MSRKKRDTRFKPGQSGNPKGRPPGEACLTNLLRAALAEKDVDGKRTKARAVIDALVFQACEGNTKAIEQVFDRIDGLLQPLKADVIDIGQVIGEVQKRAEDRKQSRDAG